MKGKRATENPLEVVLKTILGVLWEGVKQRPRNAWELRGSIFVAVGLAFVASYGRLYSDIFGHTPPLSRQVCWAILSVLGFVVLLFLWGRQAYRLKRYYQRKFDDTGFKTVTGIIPRVTEVVEPDNNRKRITLDSYGVGIERYKNKKSDLEAVLAGTMESIKIGKNPRYVEILLAVHPLPSRVSFSEVEEKLSGECSFTAGIYHSGPLQVDLRTLPHLLIAGTTGGGKSVFFRQVLFSLLKTTPRLQLYLLDLKKGVEMQSFEDLPNVEIAKTEAQAVALLEKLKGEMDRRFEFLEEKKLKEIVPTRDGMDRIVLGIDEASVLYTRPRSNEEKKNLTERARELTDELAKLSRAAGIHLILATQKVTKETIDTKVQENIGGRMCFRMNTLQGSMTVLGNKAAHELPDIKGRGIWARGADFTEVQTPFLSEEALAEGLNGLEISFHGPMLWAKTTESEKNSINLTGDD